MQHQDSSLLSIAPAQTSSCIRRKFQTLLLAGTVIPAVAFSPSNAAAATDILYGNTYAASQLGISVNPSFQGGTLQADLFATHPEAFTLDASAANNIDQNSRNAIFSGVFSDAPGATGQIQISNSGSGGLVAFTAVNTYTGTTTINPGAALYLTGSGSIAASSGVVDNGRFDISGTTAGAMIQSLAGSGTASLGTRTLTLSNASDIFSGSITGPGGLTVSGGAETLSGANTYTGTTIINTGATLKLADTGSIVSSFRNVNNGTLDISGTTAGASIRSLTGTGTIVLGDQTLTLLNAFGIFDAGIQAGGISGTGGVTIGYGTETFLSAANNYTGATTINSGAVLNLAGAGSVASSSRVIDDGVVHINLAPGGATIQSLAGSGLFTLGSRTLTISNASDVFSGVIRGIYGGLKITGGTQTLTGASTYSGATTVASGAALKLDGSLGSATTIAFGGLLEGTGTINARLVNNGTVQPGDATGTLYVNGNYVQGSTGTLEILLAGTGAGEYGHLTASGTMSLSGTLDVALLDSFTLVDGDRFDILDFASRSGDFSTVAFDGTGCTSLDTGGWKCGAHLTLFEDYTPTQLTLRAEVPEPGTLAILAAGLTGLGVARRRRA